MVTLPYILLLVLALRASRGSSAPEAPNPRHHRRRHHLLVVGSANADTFLPVDRLPAAGENVVCREDPVEELVPGGKGCTQAVAAAKLRRRRHRRGDDGDGAGGGAAAGSVHFVGQLGTDRAAELLRDALGAAGADATLSGAHRDLPTGRGYVLVAPGGEVTAVVTGGSNLRGWAAWERAWEALEKHQETNPGDNVALPRDEVLQQLDFLLPQCSHVLLQREVPEVVNRLVATLARRHGVGVLQDVGGQDRPMDPPMLALCDYLIPNETELRRLCRGMGADGGADEIDMANDETVLDLARKLQARGARNVLVTRGSRGSTLLLESGEVYHQPAILVEQVVDETGAGDCFRAAFCVALSEGKSIEECLQFATAAGSCSVEVNGAVPSTPTRLQVESRWKSHVQAQESVLHIPRGDGQDVPRGGASEPGPGSETDVEEPFPFMIGSRLNSMKDRPDLWNGPLDHVRHWVKRQGAVQGLTCVDFNYPQHFKGMWSKAKAKAALKAENLKAGAVCLRFPSKFARGAMNHPDPELREEALKLVLEAAEMAKFLDCNEVVVWSAFDGYDYPFQVNYDDKWSELVSAFQACCDAFPDIKFSVEYKPTDENTRFFTVPSTGAAVLLMQEVDRPNFGLTLDVGHMLMSGENPGQSIAMVGRTGKLFGIQLNDGYTRLAAEDGLMFGSIHPSMALEIMYQLRRIRFNGHLYFDTFPQRTDPVKEAEYNIRRVKQLWKAAGAIDSQRLEEITREHDAIGALELVEAALQGR